MDSEQVQQYSYLFTIRMWPEAVDDGQIEWRGKVRHISSGETRYFRDWPTLVAFLQELLPKLESETGSTELERG